MPKLILASASEWRAKLLKQAGVEFEVVPTNIDEESYMWEIKDPEALVKILAQKKAEACLEILHSRSEGAPHSGSVCILSADTVVAVKGEIIGKPVDRIGAKRIIQKLSGNTHQIWTGVCLLPPKQVFAEKSEVTLRLMSDQEIEAYLDTNEWVGKAGGYQIQKTLGLYITRVIGSYSNIIGLPLPLLVRWLNKELSSQ